MSASADPATEVLLAARKRQAETLESVGRLAGGIAHDFNNLLTAILGYSELLEARLQKRKNMTAECDDLDEIRVAAERARALMQRLLAFSRRMPTRPELIDLRELTTGMERLLMRFAAENITIVLRITDGRVDVLADGTQLEQVLLSLAINACDSMPEGGTLTIALDTREIGDDGYPRGELIGTLNVAPGSYVELSVADTGLGMDAELVHRAFEPFVTTKSAGQGLGLSAVYGMVSRAGGTVIVDSAVGAGTTVRVLLPRATNAHDADVPVPAQPARGRGEVILLAEDDASVRKLNVRTLHEAGYKVLAAEDGNAAVELASRTGRDFDMLITDIVMPGRNGWEVAEAIQSQRPGIPVLFVSGFVPTSLAPDSASDSNFPFLAKPFTPSALLQRVRQLLDSAATARE